MLGNDTLLMYADIDHNYEVVSVSAYKDENHFFQFDYPVGHELSPLEYAQEYADELF